MSALTVTGLSKAFGTTEVLRAVDLTVPAGSRAAVVGASGSGKSTLLRLVAGFEHPDSGSVRLGDRVLTGAGAWVPAHRRGIGYVAQDGALFPHLTVERNIGFGVGRGATRAGRVRELMELVSLDAPLARRFPHQLSGGQQQRVALARALAPGPGIILLDEPFSALDTGLRDHTREAVVEALERSGVTTVLVTHDQDEALDFGHQIAVIEGGTLVQAGRPAEVFDNPATSGLAAFLGPVVLVPATVSSGGAESVLGRLQVRHDRTGGRRQGLALLRPSQLQVAAPGAGAADGVVDAVRWRATHVEVAVRVGPGAGLVVHARVPAHDAARYAVGDPVSVSVSGGCVLYPGG